jgi:hypothetical protein
MQAAMNYSNWRSDRLVLADAVARRASRTPAVLDRVVSVLTGADVLVLTIFCIVGLLVSLAVILTLPGFSESVEAFQYL